MKPDSKACRLVYHDRPLHPHLDLFFLIPGQLTLPTYELAPVQTSPGPAFVVSASAGRGPGLLFQATRKKDHRRHYWTFEGALGRGRGYLEHISYGELGCVLTDVFFLKWPGLLCQINVFPEKIPFRG
ncbi:MAG: hypothetical protein HS115_01065 [Spirochaetales bacterium]|nr:hypothetical protein [Spirochaetales bacterium]